ncbi:hypothetical protein [Paenibacillus abyssi]|uniref:Uncharacterized protein n=1 Tax=Paenibacillus abyssi TaxID=1340531 RepID=A0A917D3R5_9BACL|nr:hypothetical protein [Paenibacillus abyssi]GGG07563.1 hypothetical protein GCM10010916_25560 [Paenibacillus abyssi]
MKKITDFGFIRHEADIVLMGSKTFGFVFLIKSKRSIKQLRVYVSREDKGEVEWELCKYIGPHEILDWAPLKKQPRLQDLPGYAQELIQSLMRKTS